jgi:hypothetical protein
MTTVAQPPQPDYLGRHSRLDKAGYAGRPVRPQADQPGTAPGSKRATLARRVTAALPLVVVLVLQAALTIKLARFAYASGDEGRYIYSGHQLIYELWHGGGSPFYETYFSGAPVIYPVLAAMADYAGGLLAVRLMSMLFMLTATCLLFGVTRRWFGYWPGILAAGLFAGIGLTQDLGALATYDAMSLMLVTVAAYCASRTGDGERHGTRWLVAVPLALLAANATKYASVLFDPVVIGVAAVQVSAHGVRRVVQRVAAVTVATATLLGVALLVGGRSYLNGVISSTFSRQADNPAFAGTTTGQDNLSSRVVVMDSADWIGAVVVLSLLALLVSLLLRKGRAWAPLLGILLAGGLLVTAEGVHLHSIESMYKHDDFGIWFSAAGAGALVSWLRPVAAKAVVTLILVAASGFIYSRDAVATYQATYSPAVMAEFAALKPYLEVKDGRFLLGGLTEDQLVYEDQPAIKWFQLTDDIDIKYPIPGRGGDSHGQRQGVTCMAMRPGCMYLEGLAAYRAAIQAHWFAVISMIGEHYTALDQQIESITSRTAGYVRLYLAPGQPTWIYAPDFGRALGGTRN